MRLSLLPVLAVLAASAPFAVGAVYAQALDIPIVDDCVADQAACYATSQVAGLDPNGDGFLAVRTGPGSDYRMIDRLHNGDVVEHITSQGPWRGVRYGGRKGWVHGNWLQDLAG